MSRNKKKTTKPGTKVVPIDPDDLEEEEEVAEQTAQAAQDRTDPSTVTTGPAKLGRSDGASFWRYTAAYPNKKALTFYFYRLEPPIDRTVTHGPDAESSIDKVLCLNGNVPDEHWLKHKWGSGRYQIRVKDTSLKPASAQNIADTILDVDEYTEFPPVIEDLKQIVDNNKNRSFIAGLVSKRQMFRDEQGVLRVTPIPGMNGAAGNDASVTSKALDMAERAMNKPPGKIEETAAVGMINMMMTGFQSILKTTIESTGGAGKAGNSDLLLTILTQNMNMQQALMLKLIEGNGGTHGSQGFSLRDALKEVKEIVTTVTEGGLLQGKENGAVASDRPAWEPTLMALANSAGPGLGAWLMSLRGAPGTPGHPAARPTPTTAPGIPASPAPAATAPAAGAGIPASPTNADETIDAEIVAEPGRLSEQEIHTLARHVLKCLQRGISGQDFALSIDTMDDYASYARIKEAVENGSVAEQFMRMPKLAATFAPFAGQVQKFMEEFIDYAGDEQPPQATDQGPAAGIAVAS